LLVRNGHIEYDILNVYSWDKVWAYYTSCLQLEKDKTRNLAIAVRCAFGAETNGFLKYLDSLEEKTYCVEKARLSKPEQVKNFVEKLNNVR